VSATVLTCPQGYNSWESTNSFPAGYQGVCSYFTRLPEEAKVEYLKVGDFGYKGIMDEYPFTEWTKDFLRYDWTNRNDWSYSISN